MSSYNRTTIAAMSTDKLEAKVAQASEAVKADIGKRPRAYYAQMAIEQHVRTLQLYTAALADRRAGLI